MGWDAALELRLKPEHGASTGGTAAGHGVKRHLVVGRAGRDDFGVTRQRSDGPGATHHVVPQGMHRGRIVLDDRDRVALRQRYHDVAVARGWTIQAGAFLDNHDHRVITTEAGDLGVGMGRILGGYARWFNTRHDREGAVFTGRFWSRRVNELRLVRACLYTDMNAFNAGLCDHPVEWPWGTYGATRGLELDRIVPPLGVKAFLVLGNSVEEGVAAYRALIERSVEAARTRRPPTTPAEAWARVDELVLRPCSGFSLSSGTSPRAG